MILWIQKTIWNFLVPAAGPSIDRAILERTIEFHKKYDNSAQKQEVALMRVIDWMDAAVKDEKSSNIKHKELMGKFDSLIEALKK